MKDENGIRSSLPNGYPDLSSDSLRNEYGQLSLSSVSELVDAFYSSPRDFETLGKFVLTAKLPEKVIIYGAGTEAKIVIQALNTRKDVEIVACVDRAFSRISECEGVKVYPPDYILESDMQDITVLVCNSAFELSINEHLDALGVFESRRFSLYSTNAYRDFSASFVDALVGGVKDLLVKNDYMIVSTCAPSWTVVPDSILTQVLPVDRTVNLVYGRKNSMANLIDRHLNGPWKSYDISFSTAVLKKMIEVVSPRVIYLRLSPHVHGEYLFSWVKNHFPHLQIIVEFYDMSLMIFREMLSVGYLLSNQDININGSSNIHALNTADLVLTKTSGSVWNNTVRKYHDRVYTYFSGLDDVQSQEGSFVTKKSDERIRVVFGGSLPAIDLTTGRPEQDDLNFLHYFDQIAGNRKIDIAIYNANHTSQQQDYRFALYMNRWSEFDNIQYNRAVSKQDFFVEASRAEVGWCVGHLGRGEKVVPASYSGIANRFTGYLNAGLPIIIDDCFDSMSQLVTEFGAGVVLTEDNYQNFVSVLENFDWSAARDGVLELRSFLKNKNDVVFERLNKYIHVIS